MLTLAAFIVTIGIIVTIHEFGHFLAAKLNGMRVKRFSIGFPPKLWSRKFGETEFAISWIPLGGYVHIAGMIDESLDEDGITGAPDEFMSKNVLQKIIVLASGVVMNYVLAFLIIGGLTAAVGVGDIAGTTIGEVISDMPALAAGVHAGDEIVSVDGQPTPLWHDVVTAINGGGDTVALSLRRDAQIIDVRIATQPFSKESKRRGIGVAPKIVRRSATVGDVLGESWSFCVGTTAGIVGFLKGLTTGASHISDLSGPLGVAQLSGESARQGSGAFLFFIAYVSVSIGFLNILPFPVLDGGHIVYVLIEAVMRRPIPTRVKLWIQQVGMGLLILLVVFVSYHDIMRIFFH
jgi:regulator of sigma E protease